jgi:membrane protein YdbS with pleckstrin-like domain
METLHPTVRIVWVISACVGAVIVGSIVGIVDRFVLHVGPWLGLAAGVVVAIFTIPFIFARYRIWRFEIQDDAVYLERGVITRVESAVPFVRVQHVDTKRGPVERLAGLGSVVIYTAGSHGADVTIPGLQPERARNIQNRLRDLAIESEEAAV